MDPVAVMCHGRHLGVLEMFRRSRIGCVRCGDWSIRGPRMWVCRNLCEFYLWATYKPPMSVFDDDFDWIESNIHAMIALSSAAAFLSTASRRPETDMALVCDMDDVLIWCRWEGQPMARRGLGHFFTTAFRIFSTVGLWTAASRAWFDFVNKEILAPLFASLGLRGFDFVWTGERCQRSHSGMFVRVTKPLSKIWRSTQMVNKHGTRRHNTLIIDDTPSTYVHNYGNALFVERPALNPRALLDMANRTFPLVVQHYRRHGTVRNFPRQ